ncbi:FMN-binding glutamate synthase family protein [Corynebacterium sp. H113]|uniref:FMN-binding glutamate synthase family protein n=1 Tax=Corynebacterium sp. H113 TaxID=3133419 RepID=UPI003096D976
MITRPYILAILAVLNIIAALAVWDLGPWWWILMGLVLVLDCIAIYDLNQKKHSLLRNYPVLGHARYLLEAIRPEMQQYFVERNFDGAPFDRDTRTVVYERAKGLSSKKSFGTERDVTQPGYEYVRHSMAPAHTVLVNPRVRIGGPDCTQPYDASIMNISAMSFGSLSPNAVLAMNKGAAMGKFVQDTGEGAISPYHLEHGADIYWQLGSGYFGARTDDGDFDPELFAQKAAIPQVKATYLKVSQGAKPGLGGMLPGDKVNEEIAATRHVPVGKGVMSPPYHRVYSTPRELVRFMGTMRQLSGGKPVGFKLCVGSQVEFLAVCKAMIEEDITPDFIIVDGSEGGTGAAPLEYSDRVGLPLSDGLMLVHNALVGAGLRDRIKLGASGKIITGFDVIKRMCIGADFVNSARGMMMAAGCIQSQLCHTNECPVGVATQDPARWKALDVDDKARRVANYHEATVQEAAQILGSMGLQDFAALGPTHLMRRTSEEVGEDYSELYNWLEPGELLRGTRFANWAFTWKQADPDTFRYPELYLKA